MKTCAIFDCNTTELCRGLCSMHYQRWRNHGDPLINKSPGKSGDPCSKCKINTRRDNNSWCQLCLNENSRKWNASEAGPRWRRYKLKKSDIEIMKIDQDNCCPICKTSFDEVKEHVDHDSACCNITGNSNGVTCGYCVRSLLCTSCNMGLGNFRDSITRLENAIIYLKKWNQTDE